MRKLFIAILCTTMLVSCKDKNGGITTDIINNPKGTGDPDYLPIMTFDEERIDFGTIKEGDKVTKVFKFTNTGKSNLVISNVSATCGCTVPNNWPKEPIEPGDKGQIEVTFNSQGKSGQQVKQITILANTSPGQNTVALAGIVDSPSEMPEESH